MEGLCPNDGKNIAPRLRPKLVRNSGEFPFKRSSKAARRRPLKRGREKTRIMVGSWRMKAHNWQPSGESRLMRLDHDQLGIVRRATRLCHRFRVLEHHAAQQSQPQ